MRRAFIRAFGQPPQSLRRRVAKSAQEQAMYRCGNGRSLNDLVGAGKQCWRQIDAERPGSLQVENQIIF
jgi:hypothetical protein